MEEDRLDHLPICLKLQKMEREFKDDRECFSCFYDLHLSASTCSCSPERYACLKHENLFCSCEINNRYVLLRYTKNELDTLVDALEGGLEAIKAWVSAEDLGIASMDKSVPTVEKPDVESGTQGIDAQIKREASFCCSGTEDKLNINASCGSQSHVSSEVVQSGSQPEAIGLIMSHITVDGHGDNDETLVMNNNSNMRQECSIDLNLDYMSDEHESTLLHTDENYENEPIINVMVTHKGGKFCSLDTRRESDMIKLRNPCCLTSTNLLLNKDYALCSRNVGDCAFDDNKSFWTNLSTPDSNSKVLPSCWTETEIVENSDLKTLVTHQSSQLQKLGSFIEPIEVGSVVFGKRWCNKQAIFPKGILQ